MSPRLRPRRGFGPTGAPALFRGAAAGRLIRLDRLGESRVAATLDLDPDAEGTAALLAEIASWEAEALRRARRMRVRSAPEFRRVAPRLRLRPSLSADRPMLRLLGPANASPAAPQSIGEAVRARFTASPAILPAAGIVALEFKLSRLLAAAAPSATGDEEDD